MSHEDLLKERFRVIGKYIYSPYRIGDLVIRVTQNSYLLTETNERDFDGNINPVDHHYPVSFIKKFPNLFAPVPWWQGRKIKDLPAYLKNKGGRVYKVKMHYSDPEKKCFSIIGDNVLRDYDRVVPATELEYAVYKHLRAI